MNNSTQVTRSSESILATNKLIRNTYMLLSATFVFSAVMAAISTIMVQNGSIAIDSMIPLGCFAASIVLIWFVLPRTAHSSIGIGVVFAFTGLLGFGLGPMLASYLAHSGEVVGTALGGTGIIFFALSGYALMTKKDFSFMGGFLMVGLLVVLVAIIANVFLQLPAIQLAIAGAFILISSGLILYNTSHMIHNPENSNYIIMTAALFVNIYNIFVSLLQILGFASDD